MLSLALLVSTAVVAGIVALVARRWVAFGIDGAARE
jgi:hypothetical protein